MKRYLGSRVGAGVLVLMAAVCMWSGVAFAGVGEKLDNAADHVGKAIGLLRAAQDRGHGFQGHVKSAIEALETAQRQIGKAKQTQ